MSEQESISREYENLELSVKEAKELLAQFPDDFTLRLNIAQAEYRLEALHSMMVNFRAPSFHFSAL